MPMYQFRCTEGHTFDRLVPLAQFDEPQSCPCGAAASRQIVAPAIRTDYAGYTCPVSGKWIEGRAAHRENLARTGCRVLEPGETSALKARQQSSEAALEAALDSTAEELIANLSSRDKERLAVEMDAGLSAEVVRV